MFPRCLLFIVFSLSLGACSGSPPAASSELDRWSVPLAAPAYIDARGYFTAPEDVDRWYALTFRLRDEFDAICGDTFCEGDFSNYESLGFRCSVAEGAGTIGECVWVFAASTDEVVPETGEVSVHTEAWRCPMPLAADTSAAEFLQALSTPDEPALYAALPGTERALYDGLMDCL
jgi:hypothetical protein